MYDFEKIPGEYIISIVDDVILKENEKERNISVILTNKRLLFLDYPSGVNNYEEMVRISRGINYMRKKEAFFILRLEEFENIETGEYDKYNLKNGNYFFLCSNEVREILTRSYFEKNNDEK